MVELDRLCACAGALLRRNRLGRVTVGDPWRVLSEILVRQNSWQSKTRGAFAMDKPGKILLVDDEEQIKSVMSRWLRDVGYACEKAADAEQALSWLAREPFILAVLDIMMPGLSGIELLKKIRIEYPDLAVIMVTGVDTPEVAGTALELGASGYIVKPFGRNELLIYVVHALHRRELEKKNREYRENLERLIRERTEELEQAYADLKSSQGHLVQQEKMATLGQLAAGVAHEVKNPTGYIGSNLGTLNRHLGKIAGHIRLQDEYISALPAEKIEEVRQAGNRIKLDFLLEDCEQIIIECLEGVNRINKIVEGLKTFSRKDKDVARPANINDCLENALTVAWNEIKYKAVVEKEYGDLPLINCFPNKLGQVFMNILVNGAHAIEDQGKITVRTRVVDDTIHVRISDTGCGMSRETMDKIFDPFFTTKEEGKGTGLGLAISHEIMEQHHGDILVESTVGKGTTFTIILPIGATQERCQG